MGKFPKASRRLKPCGTDDGASDSLRIVAFSDYGARDIATLIDFVRRLTHAPDLFLYGGDSAARPRRISLSQLLELAALTRYKVGAILGNAHNSGIDSHSNLSVFRCDNDGENRELPSVEVRDVNRTPVAIGNYVVVGCGSGPSRSARGFPDSQPHASAGHRRADSGTLRGLYTVVLSHAPPKGVGDGDGVRHHGSPTLGNFLLRRRRVPLVVCGSAALGGGKSKKLGTALVVNVASSADPARPGRVALIEMKRGKVVEVKWISLWDLSSIPGINRERKSALQKAGIRTPCDLAEAPVESIASAIQACDSETERLRARASAFCRQDVVLLRSFSLPAKNRVYLTLGNCTARDDIRLIGFHLESEDKTRILFAEAAEDEKQILVKMLRLLSSFSKLNLICYSGGLWRQQLLKRRLACYGLPTRITRSIKDLYFDIEGCLAFPTRRLGLREVAECCGFRWRDSPAIESRPSAICDAAQRFTKTQKQRLVRRSEQDLLALRHIVLYLDQVMARS